MSVSVPGVCSRGLAGAVATSVVASLLLTGALRAQELTKRWDYKTKVVVYVDGKPAQNVEVRLSVDNTWNDGTDKGGRDLTRPYRTDTNGVVMIPHSSKGYARVFIQDEWSPHGTEGSVPGTFTIQLSTDDPRQADMLDKWQRPKAEVAVATNAASEAVVHIFGPTEPPPVATNKAAKATSKKEKAAKTEP